MVIIKNCHSITRICHDQFGKIFRKTHFISRLFTFLYGCHQMVPHFTHQTFVIFLKETDSFKVSNTGTKVGGLSLLDLRKCLSKNLIITSETLTLIPSSRQTNPSSQILKFKYHHFQYLCFIFDISSV